MVGRGTECQTGIHRELNHSRPETCHLNSKPEQKEEIAMSRKNKNDLTRREFVTAVGLAGLALAAAGPPGRAAPALPPATQADTGPRRKLGKTGVDVPILSMGCMFDTINNQL